MSLVTESILQETKYSEIAYDIQSFCRDVAHTRTIPHWKGKRNKGIVCVVGRNYLMHD